MFQPDQIIFAPTSRCNLACSHCRVSRGADELSITEATTFLERCAQGGIERIGFSGGEPFLAPDFLYALSRAAVDQGLYFDRLMTNGDWFSDARELEGALQALFDAGFDGTFGLSSDSYHSQDPERLALFLDTVFRIWKRRDCVEILSVRSSDDSPWMAGLGVLADRLGGRLAVRDGEPRAIADAAPRGDQAAAGETLDIPILRFPCSAAAAEGVWDSPRWFRDDFCEGPGNVFYVHPDGSIAACCGFANENPSLILGNVRDDDYESLMKRSAESPHIRLCYEKGLDARRRELEAAGTRFPGMTDDICFFCDYLSKNDLLGD